MLCGIAYSDGLGVAQDSVKAAEYFKLSAHQGNADGQWLYGRGLADGIGMARNPMKAAKYFKLSADQGNAQGQ
jgi:TPR repeat protein